LPRALTVQQDRLIQQKLRRRNDLGANVFLLLRHTGMRIGEAADLSFDCLHASGTDQWTIHVPLGKLKTERMVPVNSFVCELVQRSFVSLSNVCASSAPSIRCPPMADCWHVRAASKP
jgi:integrase